MTKKEAKKLLDISFAILTPYFKKEFGFFPDVKIQFQKNLFVGAPLQVCERNLEINLKLLEKTCLEPLLKKNKNEHYDSVGYWLYLLTHELVHLVHWQLVDFNSFPQLSRRTYIEGVADFISWKILSEIYDKCYLLDDFKPGTSPFEFLCDSVRSKKLKDSIVYILFLLGKQNAKRLQRIKKQFIVPNFLPPEIKKIIKDSVKINSVSRRKTPCWEYCTEINKNWLPYALGFWYANKLFQSGKNSRWLTKHLLNEGELYLIQRTPN